MSENGIKRKTLFCIFDSCMESEIIGTLFGNPRPDAKPSGSQKNRRNVFCPDGVRHIGNQRTIEIDLNA
jgi:hypothetical protein